MAKWKHEVQAMHSLDASHPQLKQPGARVSCSYLEGNGIRHTSWPFSVERENAVVWCVL